MKIVIPGGSGQIGTILARSLAGKGHEVVVLTRNPNANISLPWRQVHWDGCNLDGDEGWQSEIDGCDVVINLAGRSVDCRYHKENRHRIKQSRILSTNAIAESIELAKFPPKVWLQASTATIYSHRYDAANDEVTGILGVDDEKMPDTWEFSIDVATSWEAAANAAYLPNTRLVLMRMAMVMSPDAGGVFDTLSRLARWGLGGTVGDGKQFVSWIHEEDLMTAVDWLIERDDLTGPINLAAPNPIPYSRFMQKLRSAWGTLIGIPATRWMVELAAFCLRTESELVLKSRRVVPTLLSDSGFQFRFPEWGTAATNLAGKWRTQRQQVA